MIYFIYYQFDDDRVTQKDKPVAVLPNVYHENFSYFISHIMAPHIHDMNIYHNMTSHAIVWKKFAVGNIHEKKIHGKILSS